MTNVVIVIGNPAFKYSTNDRCIPFDFADSATIKLATDPSNVKFPAKVVAMAKVSQATLGLTREGIRGRNSNTAGTFEMRLLNSTEITANDANP